ncbi:MAG: pilus assembly protein [Actinobacteria bacterium]|nr:pilus assembly protein [Actinomycetota bacterium]
MNGEGKKWFGGRDSAGSVMLELALIMPVLLMLIAAIVQFGFLLNAKIAVNSASYEAARAATLSENPESDAMRAAEAYANSTLPGWSMSERLKVEYRSSGSNPGDRIEVSVTYSVPVFFINYFPAVNAGSGCIDIRGSSLMSMEEKE